MPTQVPAANEDEAVTNPPPTGEIDESHCTLRSIPSPQTNGESSSENEGTEPKEQHGVSEETGDTTAVARPSALPEALTEEDRARFSSFEGDR